MVAVPVLGTRAEKTRGTILDAAEAVFAEKGFAATRLEDVAAIVGIRRASIVYYFRDKRDLYEAVLERLFSNLHARFREVMSPHLALATQVETAVSAWVDYIGEHPTLARLLLREIADASGAVPEPAVVRHVRPLLGAIEHVVRAGQRQGIFEPVDPVHLASTIAGATVFFVAATPLLGKDWPFDPLSKDQLATHRSEVLRITRRLLGAARLRQAKRPSTGR